MKLLELQTNRVLVDLSGSRSGVRYDLSRRWVDTGRTQYRRADQRLVVNDGGGYRAELSFEFRRLTAGEVSQLRAVYQSGEPFICVPDPVDAPQAVYVVRWVSGFDWQDTVKTDWSQGRSLKVVFEEV